MGPEGLFASLITCLSTGRVRSTSSTITSTHMRIHPIYPIYTICPISNPFWNSIASPWSLAGPCKVCHAQNVNGSRAGSGRWGRLGRSGRLGRFQLLEDVADEEERSGYDHNIVRTRQRQRPPHRCVPVVDDLNLRRI